MKVRITQGLRSFQIWSYFFKVLAQGLFVYIFLNYFLFSKIKKTQKTYSVPNFYFFGYEIQITITVFREYQNGILYVFKNYYQEQFFKI